MTVVLQPRHVWVSSHALSAGAGRLLHQRDSHLLVQLVVSDMPLSHEQSAGPPETHPTCDDAGQASAPALFVSVEGDRLFAAVTTRRAEERVSHFVTTVRPHSPYAYTYTTHSMLTLPPFRISPIQATHAPHTNIPTLTR